MALWTRPNYNLACIVYATAPPSGPGECYISENPPVFSLTRLVMCKKRKKNVAKVRTTWSVRHNLKGGHFHYCSKVGHEILCHFKNLIISTERQISSFFLNGFYITGAVWVTSFWEPVNWWLQCTLSDVVKIIDLKQSNISWNTDFKQYSKSQSSVETTVGNRKNKNGLWGHKTWPLARFLYICGPILGNC